MKPLVAWFLVMMHAWVPNGFLPGFAAEEALETKEETDDRFQKIAETVDAIVTDPAEEPIFSGEYARIQTGTLILSIAFHESGFRKTVDEGTERGDHGRSWCLMQVNLGKKLVPLFPDSSTYVETSARATAEGWYGRELVTDYNKCLRAGFHIARSTWNCGSFYDHLTPYASGDCLTQYHYNKAKEEGDTRKMQRIQVVRRVSRELISAGTYYFQRNKPTFKDEDIMRE